MTTCRADKEADIAYYSFSAYVVDATSVSHRSVSTRQSVSYSRVQGKMSVQPSIERTKEAAMANLAEGSEGRVFTPVSTLHPSEE